MNGLGSSWHFSGQSLLFVYMKIPSCWPRVLKGNCQPAGTIKGLIPWRKSKHVEFLKGPLSSWVPGDEQMRIWLGWPIITCPSISKGQETFLTCYWVRFAGKEPSTCFIVYNLMVRTLGLRDQAMEQNLLAWGGWARQGCKALVFFQPPPKRDHVPTNPIAPSLTCSSHLLGHGLPHQPGCLLQPQDVEWIT